jgi:glycosyltransferase involved in cell wall biosynthesis
LTPRSSIVIRAFNEEQHIGKLLTGISQQSLKEVEVIVVDSGSTDATVAIASHYPVRVLSIPPQEFSFGRSLNRGCAEAGGEFLVFVSAHAYPVYPDWLERLLRPFADPRVALVYGKQRGNGTTKFSEAQQLAKLFPEVSLLEQRIPLCNNANAAIRRALWQQRPYNESLPGLEDVEWAAWALSQGHLLSYSAEAEIVHVHDETPRQVYNRYRREAIGLKHIQPRERFHLLDFVRLFASNATSDLWRALRTGQLARVWWEVLWFRLMQFWGTYRGFEFKGSLTRQLIQAFYYPGGERGHSSVGREGVDPIDYGEAAGGPRGFAER